MMDALSMGDAEAVVVDASVLAALAFGMPVGGDIEYTDEVTLGRALAGRRDL